MLMFSWYLISIITENLREGTCLYTEKHIRLNTWADPNIYTGSKSERTYWY